MPPSRPPSDGQSICLTYAPPPAGHDELWTPEQTIRKPWQDYMAAIQREGCAELTQKRLEIARQLRENGAAYNIHGDPQGRMRPWQLDIVPLILGRDAWQQIEAGLAQRARLMDLLLRDLYGPATLIGEGLIPAALIFSHDGFLRPCRDVANAASRQLICYAADLARDADGGFRVIGDHTQMPRGIGHALENRTVMANVNAPLLRVCKVQRLSSFFRRFRDELTARAPRRKDQPRIAIYATDPRQRDYFEQAYLGGYLNYPVVQGEDLTVRGGRVWLKTLYGLKQVDTLLRLRSDRSCDPLELDPTADGGLAGLLEAVRREQVITTNPLGSGVLENPGLMAYLPAIARRLLGEELLLPQLDAWWCGDDAQRRHVLEHLPRLVIKPLNPQGAPASIPGFRLSKAQCDEWRARIARDPHLYAAQARLIPATAPALMETRFQPLPTAMRAFAIATGEDAHEVMPGGIARCRSARAAEGPPEGEEGGDILKDIWMIADRPQRHVSLWLQSSPIGQALQRQTELPSRTAENLFWVGRYAERAELLARLLRTFLQQIENAEVLGDEGAQQSLAGMLDTIWQMAHVAAPPADPAPAEADQYRAAIAALIRDQKQTTGLMASLGYLFNAAQAERERWSSDTWRILNDLKELHQSLGRLSGAQRQMRPTLDRLVTSLLAFSGLCQESMSRELGWVLLDCGRRLERGLMLGALIRHTLAGDGGRPADTLLMESVLLTTENIITYRRRYRSYMALNTVLDLLLMDDKNPRSLIFQLDRLQAHIGELPRERGNYRVREEERLALEAVSRIRLSDMDALCQVDADTGALAHLETLLDHIRRLLEKASDAISHAYFIHTPKSKQLTDPSPGAAP
jgi:uncharacterized circularly permuted ATP-grasp superfamily protein/uncharacterized alpha-E superfamily protein